MQYRTISRHTVTPYLRRRSGAPGGSNSISGQGQLSLVGLATLIFLAANCAVGGDALATALDSPDHGDASYDELLLFEELPVVFSASRQAQPINESSVPVSVVTSDDIHFSGLTNLYEILQFQPGVDMLTIDRNRYALGIRGLHEVFSDRTLTLIDGRYADSPMFGGSELLRLPIFLEDIERIEIVRGPGGAVWGANAFNGAVNIITKAPGTASGALVTGTIDEFGDYYTHARWADSREQWHWRLSLGYQDLESSNDAIDVNEFRNVGFSAGSSNTMPRDFHQNFRINATATYDMDEDNVVSMGLGVSSIEQGDFEVTGVLLGKNSDLTTVRSYLRLDRTIDENESAYVQWYGTYTDTGVTGLASYSALDNNLDFQYDVRLDPSHTVSLGGNIRLFRIDTDNSNPEDLKLEDAPFDEEWAGLFGLDRWRVTDRWTIETQLRGDYYSGTNPDWAGRMTSLFAIDDQKRHIWRLSAARAFRTPLAAIRELETERVFQVNLPPVVNFSAVVSQADDLDNEEIASLETGYTAQLNPSLSFRIDAYMQRYENVIGFRNIPSANPFQNITQIDNIDGAKAAGAEAELTFKHSAGTVSLWYAYNDFETDRRVQSTRAFAPALNKAGINGRLYLPRQWTVNLNYKVSDITRDSLFPANEFDSFHRLDLTVAKRFHRDRCEWLIGVSDLLDDTGFPVLGVNNFTAHETPGRTVFTRFSAYF